MHWKDSRPPTVTYVIFDFKTARFPEALGSKLACPICEKRRAKRFCPAKAQIICSVCCGSEREVTIDCPSDCPYLMASRQYDYERREIDWSKVPFPEIKIPPSALGDHTKLLAALAYTVCIYSRENRALVDSDVVATLQSLAETYRTLSSGIYYEKPPDYRLRRELYENLKDAIKDYKEAEARQVGMMSVRDGVIRDALIFLAQLGASHANGRPKGRAYLDLLRTQFKSEEFGKPASNIVLL